MHDVHHPYPSLAFALARLNTDDHSPTPFGVFREVDRPEYAGAVGAQLAAASEPRARATSQRCCARNGTWTVDA